MTDIDRRAEFHATKLRETTNWVCEACGNVRSSGDCRGCELKALREFEQTVRKECGKITANGVLVMEAQLSRAIQKLDEQRKAKR